MMMNRSGFTIVEVMIASALIVTLVTAGAVGFTQISRPNQQASANTALTDMQSKVYSAISDAGMCALQFGNFVRPNMLVAKQAYTLDALLDRKLDPLRPLIKNGAMTSDGVTYWLSLKFPTAIAEASFPAGGSRITPTNRYILDLEIRGERSTLKKMGGAQTDIYLHIPLYAEFEQVSRKMASCTYHADMVDDGFLFGGTHRATDCELAGGVVMPTTQGPICRFPVLVPPQTVSGYGGFSDINKIPKCSDIPGGLWTAVVGPGAIPFNSTLPIHIDGHNCHGTVSGDTEFHSMSPNTVESQTIRIKKGSDKALTTFLAGTAVLYTAAFILNPALGLAIVAVVALVGALYNWLHCKKVNFTFYSQVNGIGCI